MDLIPPSRWNHVKGIENPADCASRGLLPSELVNHPLWCTWTQSNVPPNTPAEEADEICHLVTVASREPIIPIDCYSSFTRLKRVTVWALRFVYNCRRKKADLTRRSGPLTVAELDTAEKHWITYSQEACFADDIAALKSNQDISSSSQLLPLHPFLDSSDTLRVGGRLENAELPFYSQHQVILSGKHPIVRLLIRSEHSRLLHAGQTLLAASLGRRFHIIGGPTAIRNITRGCVTCRRQCAKPIPPPFGQLPMERVTPDSVFNRVGVDYAGPIYIKLGAVRRPTIVKAYVAVFVSLSVKAVHLEAVSDLSTEAFLACLRRFVARRGKPSLLWSDHGTNFVGATSDLKEMAKFLEQQKTQGIISDFCSANNIVWKFIPEHGPHFGGLWEAAVKSTKHHLRRIVGSVKLNFEELTTVLAQIEACLNSRPLTPLTTADDGVEALSPGHFLIGRPLQSLPDPSFSYRSLTLLRRWDLCQALVRHFWKRWSSEYIVHLQKFGKWHRRQRNLAVGDVVLMKEDNLVPAKWPIARVEAVSPGRDGIVRVVTIRTPTGTYTRPAVKVTTLLPTEQ